MPCFAGSSELYEVAVEMFTSSSKCHRIAEQMTKETMRAFIFNWHSIIHSDAESAKEREKVREQKQYAIGKDGNIYQTDDTNTAKDDYFRCKKVNDVLNEHWMFDSEDESFSYSSIHAEIKRTFDDWYETSPFDEASNIL